MGEGLFQEEVPTLSASSLVIRNPPGLKVSNKFGAFQEDDEEELEETPAQDDDENKDKIKDKIPDGEIYQEELRQRWKPKEEMKK